MFARFRRSLLTLALAVFPMAAQALGPRDGWIVHDTDKSFADLVQAVRDAVSEAPIAIVTPVAAEASVTGHRRVVLR